MADRPPPAYRRSERIVTKTEVIVKIVEFAQIVGRGGGIGVVGVGFLNSIWIFLWYPFLSSFPSLFFDFSPEVETTTPTTPERENPCAAGLFGFDFLHQSYTFNYTNYTLFWKSLRAISMHCAYLHLEAAEKV